MKINFDEFEKNLTDGKWFDFDTEIGDISLKLRHLTQAERSKMTTVLNKSVEDQFKVFIEVFKLAVIDWRKIQNTEGKDIPFNDKNFERFFPILFDVKMVDPKTKLKRRLVIYISEILIDSSRFLEVTESSFL
jgi:hypothetical protein